MRPGAGADDGHWREVAKTALGGAAVAVPVAWIAIIFVSPATVVKIFLGVWAAWALIVVSFELWTRLPYKSSAPDFDPHLAMMNDLGFTVIEAENHPRSFGSWFITVEAAGEPLRIVWDGREGALSVQEPSPGGRPDDWSDRWTAGDRYARKPPELQDYLLARGGA